MAFIVRRPNTVFSDAYRALLSAVREARRDAGVSQRVLAARLGKSHSHVCMIERGQRRIDSLELYRMAQALRIDPNDLFGAIAERIAASDAAERGETP